MLQAHYSAGSLSQIKSFKVFRFGNSFCNCRLFLLMKAYCGSKLNQSTVISWAWT